MLLLILGEARRALKTFSGSTQMPFGESDWNPEKNSGPQNTRIGIAMAIGSRRWGFHQLIYKKACTTKARILI
jgi:hypothetical protein